MKKVSLTILSVLMLFALTACSSTPDSSINEPPAEATPSIVTEFESSDAELHEGIGLWDFSEGEPVENLYYTKAVDADGNPVYAVKRTSDGQVAYLPMGETVLYTSESNVCYYEKTVLSYKVDGAPQSSTQYQLYVTALVPTAGDTNDTEEIPDMSIVVSPPEVSDSSVDDGVESEVSADTNAASPAPGPDISVASASPAASTSVE